MAQTAYRRLLAVKEPVFINADELHDGARRDRFIIVVDEWEPKNRLFICWPVALSVH
jgi:hypothetical protein